MSRPGARFWIYMVCLDNSSAHFLPLNIASARRQLGRSPFTKTHLTMTRVLLPFEIFDLILFQFWGGLGNGFGFMLLFRRLSLHTFGFGI